MRKRTDFTEDVNNFLQVGKPATTTANVSTSNTMTVKSNKPITVRGVSNMMIRQNSGERTKQGDVISPNGKLAIVVANRFDQQLQSSGSRTKFGASNNSSSAKLLPKIGYHRSSSGHFTRTDSSIFSSTAAMQSYKRLGQEMACTERINSCNDREREKKFFSINDRMTKGQCKVRKVTFAEELTIIH